ncbi:SPOR domain-containing protein [Sphingomicrobium lutaoense]|uniref:Tetratricopeptide (TPR) repeat protein/cell division protein FtsN n=1 Tax=Sphingomicrobium lutaoense TaxID=515949 RepID=A0A839YYY3_9SPHN|nr:SPOR domain-containing protein [Sphingomicrobium lutaoense]MBB3764349.1 tetratricopeptide (TPR) repeat protein/cell division protein FtsN [Sphingomicrobium lutaoense]
MQTRILKNALTSALAATALAVAMPASAQHSGEPPADVLKRQLQTLNSRPNDMEALVAAGYASLDLGDYPAAGGFFGRAADVNPNDPRPQAGMGAVMAENGEAERALAYFAAAERLGASPAQFGVDRGLAYDLIGQLKAAEADYRKGLGTHRDAQARRRLALNLAMQGDRTAALAFLKPLLDAGDPAAQRGRAFVLALTGDLDGARRAFDSAMPGTADRIDPFIRKLGIIAVPQKAAAVHLGRFPSDDQIQLSSRVPTPQARTVPQRSVAENVSRPEPRPAPEAQRSADQEDGRRVRRFRQVVAERPTPHGPDRRVKLVEINPDPDDDVDRAEPENNQNAPSPGLSDFTLPSAAAAAQHSRVESVSLPPAERQEPRRPASSRLAGIDEALERLPAQGSQPRTEVPPAPRPRYEPPPAPRPRFEAPRAEPQRAAPQPAPQPDIGVAGTYWVQLAGGSRKDAMPYEWRRISRQAGNVLNGQTGHVTQGVDFFRLLVGPFRSDDEAQEMVNKLRAEGVDSFTWQRRPALLRIEKIGS